MRSNWEHEFEKHWITVMDKELHNLEQALNSEDLKSIEVTISKCHEYHIDLTAFLDEMDIIHPHINKAVQYYEEWSKKEPPRGPFLNLDRLKVFQYQAEWV